MLKTPKYARTLATLMTGLALMLFTGAWTVRSTRQLHNRAHVGTAHALHAVASTTTVKTLATFWWNDGSCHGYPDVMQIWEVFRDENGNLIEYRDAGLTAGTDSCNSYHESTFSDDPDYLDCGGCDDENGGIVQGSPTGTTTGHPE